MDMALSIGVEDVRPSWDVRPLLIPESPTFRRGEYVKTLYNRYCKWMKSIYNIYKNVYKDVYKDIYDIIKKLFEFV